MSPIFQREWSVACAVAASARVKRTARILLAKGMASMGIVLRGDKRAGQQIKVYFHECSGRLALMDERLTLDTYARATDFVPTTEIGKIHFVEIQGATEGGVSWTGEHGAFTVGGEERHLTLGGDAINVVKRNK